MPNSSPYTLPRKHPRLESYPMTSCSCGNSVTLKVTSDGIVGVYAPCDETLLTLAKIANEKTPCGQVRSAILTELRDCAALRVVALTQGSERDALGRVAKWIFLVGDDGCYAEYVLADRDKLIEDAQYHVASIVWAHSNRRQKIYKERKQARHEIDVTAKKRAASMKALGNRELRKRAANAA